MFYKHTFLIQCNVINHVKSIVFFTTIINEPRREKTGLRGFRPGPTQTGLYSLRSRLEA